MKTVQKAIAIICIAMAIVAVFVSILVDKGYLAIAFVCVLAAYSAWPDEKTNDRCRKMAPYKGDRLFDRTTKSKNMC